MKQDEVLGLALLLTLAAPLALAQETWTPQINVSPVRDFLVQVLKWTTYVAVLFIITYVVLKVLYGRALARLFELAEFDLYMDTFGVGSGCLGVEKPLGRTYAPLGQLALEAERRGARELAEYLRVRAKLQLLTGEALRALFEIATRDYHASFTGVNALLAPWASWDEWMYSEEGTEWKNRVS
jgi:hypothetical protein